VTVHLKSTPFLVLLLCGCAPMHVVSGSLVASAAFDMETTVRVLETGCCYEINPIAKPFVNNRASAYAFGGGITVLYIWGTHYLKSHNYRLWWLPAIATSAVHIVAGFHNLSLMP